MLRTKRQLALGAALAFALATPTALAQVASALLTEDAAIPGAGGATADALNTTAVNHAGGYAIGISSSDGLSRVWGNASGGAGDVMRTEATIGDLVQTSFESFYGISNSGQVSYSAIANNRNTGATSLDGVWLDDAVVAIEEDPVIGMPGFFWVFGSRPGVTAGGTPYWVGGVSNIQGGSTQLRGLFYDTDASPVLLSGDVVPNLPAPLDTSTTVDFDYRFSENGARYLAPVNADTGSTTNDTCLVLDGVGLLLGGSLVIEASPVPASVGGLPGENWDNFDFVGVTEGGKYFFTGDSDGDSATDEFVVVDGEIRLREGDMVDGQVLSGAIEGGYMNANGDLALIWDVDDPVAGNIEVLLFNNQIVLREGDEVDLDGDGVVDPGAVLRDFTGISTLTVGDQDVGGVANIYFTADIDTEGTSSSTDDTEGFFCLPVQGAECFLVFGPAPGEASFLPGGHLFTTQVADIMGSWAVSMEDIPSFALPAPTQLGGQAMGQLPGGQQTELVLDEFVVQVVMWNPYVFPQQPEQFTHGLLVRVLPDGQVLTEPFGDTTGMQIWAEVATARDGSRSVSFPFSIPGL